jgi:hypothetical protein
VKINALTTLPMAAAMVPSAVATKNQAFQGIFKRMAPPADAATRRKQAEEAAAGLVSGALILPMLKQIRRTSFNGGGPFSAGIGEKTFGPEFDMQIADRIAHSPELGIRKALANRLMSRGQEPQAATHKDVDVHG